MELTQGVFGKSGDDLGRLDLRCLSCDLERSGYFFAVAIFFTGFFAVVVFVTLAFAVAFLAFTVFAAVDFVDFVGFTERDFASFARAAFRREAVFFLIKPFFAALSYSDWTRLAFSAVGFDLNSRKADLMFFLIC